MVVKKSNRREIVAVLANGQAVKYTTAVLFELMFDDAVVEIWDSETGELIYEK